MDKNLRLARLFFVLLLIVTAGRWILGFRHVPYAEGTDKFSIVTLTIFGAIFYGAFVRRWQGYTLVQAALLGALLGFSAQVLVFLSTAITYGLGIDTYFSFPRALNVDAPIGFADAMLRRVGGMFFNTLSGGIVGAIGWAFGGLLPEK
jgi:hypothetical protein